MYGMSEQDQQQTVLSFQEYRLFYESAERVTDRRISLNKSNYAICLGVVVADAVIANWAASRDDQYFYFALGAIIAISSLAVLFCVGWLKQIRDYKNLNTAKFRVLTEMADAVRFETDYGDTPKSYRPFDREWEIMTEMQGLTPHGMSSALSASKVEYLLPKALIGVFVLFMLLAVSEIVTKWLA